MARLIDSVIGHRGLWQTLERQMESGRLPHAMAFAGPAGIGKKRIAMALVQALLCDGKKAPCGSCPACLRNDLQTAGGMLLIEPQNGSIKLEASEQVLRYLGLRALGRARVVVIDDAHLLNPQATNALLKIIEEPPSNVYFVLIVNEISQLLPTLRSRLQVLRFAPLTADEISLREAAPEWMLRSARGSFARLAGFRDEDSAELRALVMNFVEGSAVGRRSGLEDLLDQTRERDRAMAAALFLQSLLRDWSLAGLAEPMHTDLGERLRALPERPLERRVELWRQSFQLERDLVGHVDRTLLFENFFFKLRSPT